MKNPREAANQPNLSEVSLEGQKRQPGLGPSCSTFELSQAACPVETTRVELQVVPK
jgi:hypothetical protein